MAANLEYGKDFRIYNEEEIEKMFNLRLCGIPASFYLLDLRKTLTFCHLSSDILAYCLQNANRVSGEIPTIKGEDKLHSWVETNNEVYDPTQGIVWNKVAYYKQQKPSNVTIHSIEESEENLKEYLKYTDNMPEMYMAWIEDLKAQEGLNIYEEDIANHIERLLKEKSIDKEKLSIEMLEEYKQDLKEVYEKAQKFIEQSEQKESKGK